MSNAPNEDPDDIMTDFERRWAEREREAERQKREAEQMAAYLCGALRFLGVRQVTAVWDGYGDDGQTGDPVFDPPLSGELPFGLPDEIDRLWDPILPPGCEINAGSFGTLTLDVTAGTVSHDIEYRDDDEEFDEEDEE